MTLNRHLLLTIAFLIATLISLLIGWIEAGKIRPDIGPNQWLLELLITSMVAIVPLGILCATLAEVIFRILIASRNARKPIERDGKGTKRRSIP